MTVFFTSDQHFGDLNWGYGVKKQVGNKSDREVKLVTKWNETVTEKDTVYVLGDFAETVEDFMTYHEVLNGTKIYLLGNHDPKALHNKGVCEWLFPGVEFLHGEGHRVDYGYETFFVSHRPFASWPWDTIHLHGHLHGGKSVHANEEYMKVKGRADVGVDSWENAPVSADTLIEKEDPWAAYRLSKGFSYYHWGALDDPFGLDGWAAGVGSTTDGYDLSKDPDWRPASEKQVETKTKKRKRKKRRNRKWDW
jgi:calcineurin-like phosphoesterase family protein